MNNKLNILSNTPSNDENELTVDKLLKWDGPFCSQGGERVVPKIYMGEGDVPYGYNGVVITLDGKAKSDLEWIPQIRKAERFMEAGYRVLWMLDLGLFDELPFSLFNNSQIMTLSLGIDHFNESIWERFSSDSFGLCLYRGALDFSKAFSWDEKQTSNLKEWMKERGVMGDINFEELPPAIEKNILSLYACDVGMDYLDILAQSVSDDVECFALLDIADTSDSLLQARLLNTERSDRIRFVVKGGRLPPQDLVWGGENCPFGLIGEGSVDSPKENKAALGLCMPEVSIVSSEYYEVLKDVIEQLTEKNIFFRFVSEAKLTTEWDGLDYLIVSEKLLSPFGIRKLQGFCAAGGTVVNLGDQLDLSQEISFSEWIKSSIM